MRHSALHLLLGAAAVGLALTVPHRLAGGEEAAAPAPAAGLLSTAEFDPLARREVFGEIEGPAADDLRFLRRATFDLLGRLPTLDEQRAFVAAAPETRDRELVERLLASDEFGANWADYWTDVIAFHVPPPELTYLNYGPLKDWLARQFNSNRHWDEVVRELVTAKGKIADHPPATFVGYHNAVATNLAGETARIFLAQQIGCAQCHDHPFDHWKRAQFHELAAFFGRTKVKLSQNDGTATVVSAVEKGEYLMPDMADPSNKGTAMRPAALDGAPLDVGPGDAQRRKVLAAWLTSRDNPWFARAYVNRVWARLFARGFYEPLDDLGDSRSGLWPETHAALARHFTASGCDVKGLFHLLATSAAYRRAELPAANEESPPSAPARMRGDEVFAALRVGLALPNVTPPAVAPTAAIRFPPPPKSTRDLVHEAFGADPSLAPVDAPRTIAQALWMMNNEQLQKQIDATPESGTMLARLLADEPDDSQAVRDLFARVLAREATQAEMRIALEHVSAGAAGARPSKICCGAW